MTGVFGWGSRKVFDAVDNIQVSRGQRDPETGKRGEEASQVVDKQFKEALNDESIKNINRAIEIEDSLGPFSPTGKVILTPAEQMVDPPLLRAQKTLETKGDAEFIRKNNE